ncbi:unnamed protein product [Caenorhabditis brenneri]
MLDEEDGESGFKPGHEIVSQKATYTVVRLLGEGCFGVVYLCKTNKGTQCAMKVEKKMEERKYPKLETEYEFLKSGTVRFASLSCHRNIEMGPKDDCESWFNLLLDLILVGGLPWKKLKERNEVLLAKEECRKEKRHTLYTGLKNSVVLNIILVYIDSQAHQDRVSYQFIYETLKEACHSAGHDIDAPYDWENSKNSLTVKPSPEEEKTQKNCSTIEGNRGGLIERKTTSRYEFYGILQSFIATNLEPTQKLNDLMDVIQTKRDEKSHAAQVPPKNLSLFVEMLLWGVEESIRHSWNEQRLVDFNVRNLCDSVTDVLEALEINVDDVKYNSLFPRNRMEDKKKVAFLNGYSKENEYDLRNSYKHPSKTHCHLQ